MADGYSPQTNIARADGRRGVLMNILKAGNASTIDVVSGIRNILPKVAQTLPPELKIQPIADQSIFVRAAITGVVREAILAACLTAAMILLFLGSWRSTVIIAVSIPLSIFTSIICLGFLGQTINIMTLGGLALAVGILVDDATVTIENMERYLEEGDGLTYRNTRRGVADRRSGLGVDPLYLHRLRADVHVGGRGALSIRPAGGSRRVRHARVVRAVAHPCSDYGSVFAACEIAP